MVSGSTPFAQQPCIVTLATLIIPCKVTSFIPTLTLDHRSTLCVILQSSSCGVVIAIIIPSLVLLILSKRCIRVGGWFWRCGRRGCLFPLGEEHFCASCFHIAWAFLDEMYQYMTCHRMNNLGKQPLCDLLHSSQCTTTLNRRYRSFSLSLAPSSSATYPSVGLVQFFILYRCFLSYYHRDWPSSFPTMSYSLFLCPSPNFKHRCTRMGVPPSFSFSGRESIPQQNIASLAHLMVHFPFCLIVP